MLRHVLVSLYLSRARGAGGVGGADLHSLTCGDRCVSPLLFATQCYLQHSAATQYCTVVLRHATATRYRNTLYCNALLLHATAP